MKVRVDLICYLAQNGVFTNTTAEFILADLVEKVGDVKNGAGCQEALSCIAEATSLEFVSSQVFITPDNIEPRREKTGLRGFRPGLTQTELYSHRKRLEA